LKRDPNTSGVYGAARTAATSGNRRAAGDYYAKLLELAANQIPSVQNFSKPGHFLGS
jgi:hypothetical protein